MKHAPIPLALTLLALTVAHAASAPTPPANLVVCSQVSDPGERLKCYDTQIPPPSTNSPSTGLPPAVTAAPKGEPAPAPTNSAPIVTPEAAPTAEQKFGAESLPSVAREKVVKSDRVLLSTIASVHEIRSEVGSKIFNISLANGQLWRQEGTTITRFFRAGDDVRIEEGLLGDYRMSTSQTGAKNWVKVVRIR